MTALILKLTEIYADLFL